MISWLKAEFMQEKVGEEFDGIISGVREFGIFVQLNEIFVDGLVHVTSLGNDYYHYDPARFQLQGEHKKQRFRLGDRVRIRVVRVDMEEAKIDFELVAESGSVSKNKPGSRTTNSKNRTGKPRSTPGEKKGSRTGKKNKSKNRKSSNQR